MNLGIGHPETTALCDKGEQKSGTGIMQAEVQPWDPDHSRKIAVRRRKK